MHAVKGPGIRRPKPPLNPSLGLLTSRGTPSRQTRCLQRERKVSQISFFAALAVNVQKKVLTARTCLKKTCTRRKVFVRMHLGAKSQIVGHTTNVVGVTTSIFQIQYAVVSTGRDRKKLAKFLLTLVIVSIALKKREWKNLATATAVIQSCTSHSGNSMHTLPFSVSSTLRN